jgi:hypothetical protein
VVKEKTEMPEEHFKQTCHFLGYKKKEKERTGSRKKESLEQYSRNTSGIPRTLPCCLFTLLFFQVCLYCYHL